MSEEVEIISLIYGVMKGLKAYRDAHNKLNGKQEESNREISLEEVIDKYKKIEKLTSLILRVLE